MQVFYEYFAIRHLLYSNNDSIHFWIVKHIQYKTYKKFCGFNQIKGPICANRKNMHINLYTYNSFLRLLQQITYLKQLRFTEVSSSKKVVNITNTYSQSLDIKIMKITALCVSKSHCHSFLHFDSSSGVWYSKPNASVRGQNSSSILITINLKCVKHTKSRHLEYH